jgi:hypothetical protein
MADDGIGVIILIWSSFGILCAFVATPRWQWRVAAEQNAIAFHVITCILCGAVAGLAGVFWLFTDNEP